MTGDGRTIWQPVSTGGNQDLFIEVTLAGGREEVGLLDSIPMERVMSLVSEVAQAIGESLERVAPTKAGVELGIEFGIQEGKLVGLIARGSGKANLKISLEWDRQPKES